MAAHEPDNPEGSPEGGPVKTFLEHLEDFRWVLIKSVVALFLAMLVCLIGANHVVQIIKWPLKQADMGYPITVTEVEPSVPIERNGYAIVPFGVSHHGAAAVGYAAGARRVLGRKSGPGRKSQVEVDP